MCIRYYLVNIECRNKGGINFKNLLAYFTQVGLLLTCYLVAVFYDFIFIWQFLVAVWCMSVIYRKFTFPKTFTWGTKLIQLTSDWTRITPLSVLLQFGAPYHQLPDEPLCCILHDHPVTHWCPAWLHELCRWAHEVCRSTVLPGVLVTPCTFYDRVPVSYEAFY